MPDKLDLFLQTLSDEDALAIYDWLDEDPAALDKMADLICETNETLKKYFSEP